MGCPTGPRGRKCQAGFGQPYVRDIFSETAQFSGLGVVYIRALRIGWKALIGHNRVPNYHMGGGGESESRRKLLQGFILQIRSGKCTQRHSPNKALQRKGVLHFALSSENSLDMVDCNRSSRVLQPYGQCGIRENICQESGLATPLTEHREVKLVPA